MAEKDKYTAGEVATSTEQTVYNSETKEHMTIAQALAVILNKIDK